MKYTRIFEIIIGIGGVLSALTVIGIFLTKGISLIVNLNKKVEQLDNISDIKESIKDTKSNYIDLKKDVSQITLDLKDLSKKFENHCIDNQNQTELLLSESRQILINEMKTSIDFGYVSVDRRKSIGDLFASYEKNHGNHGVRDIYEVYRQLPFKPQNKDEE